MTSQKFERWRQTLASELIAAYTHYHIWEQLWPSQDSISVLNAFRVFFHYTREAHRQMFFLRVAKVMERRRTINLWRWLDEVEKDTNLTPNLPASDIKQLRAKLEGHKEVLGRIRKYRDKRVAHIDECDMWADSTVTIGEAKILLQDLGSVFNAISVGYDRNSWSLKPVGLEDTSWLLKKLTNF